MNLNRINQVVIILMVLLVFIGMNTNNSLLFALQDSYQDYLIGPQDKLKIEVWDHSDLVREVSVSLSGSFTFPLIGEIKAIGKSAEQIQEEITERLADGYIINPQVTVTVTAFLSKQVNILGEVRKPGAYPYTGQINFLGLISLAGGLTIEAGPEAYILRSQDSALNDRSTRRGSSNVDYNFIRIDLNDLLKKGEDIHYVLTENDTIYIPRADFFYVLGEVKSPGQYKLERGLNILKAISKAGGETGKANLKKISIIRIINGKEREMLVSLSDPVLANDIIKIPESFF